MTAGRVGLSAAMALSIVFVIEIRAPRGCSRAAFLKAADGRICASGQMNNNLPHGGNNNNTPNEKELSGIRQEAPVQMCPTLPRFLIYKINAMIQVTYIIATY